MQARGRGSSEVPRTLGFTVLKKSRATKKRRMRRIYRR
jgi:hypothetical protein